MEKLHLDSEYRDRWIEFHLASGKVEDSRLKNWRHVAWDQVISVSAHLLEHVHEVKSEDPSFRAFMNFRWGGQEARYDSGTGKYIGHRAIRVWTVGWTDGEICFLKDIDFYTGQLIKNYIASLFQFKGHIHPLVRNSVLRKDNNGLCELS